MCRYSLVLLTVLLAGEVVWADRLRCERPDYILNGSYRLKRNFMRVVCNTGYQLQGLKTIGCVRGKWDGEKPVCAKKGCTKIQETPDNGRIQIENDLKAILYCSDNFSLAGNRYSYCNGTHWDRPIGTCREQSENISHQCDFETDDVCGWSYEARANLEWKRVMAANVFTSFKTGPRHDHTTLTHHGGHYMLMESLVRQYMPVTLTSPIYDRELSLKTVSCFQFYYFMYGAGIGDLLVLVKPVSVTLDDILISRNEFIKFERNGNQNNNWNEAHFTIEELEEDFQIVFVAKSGRNQLSDIAIDDVRLLTGEDCKALDETPDDAMSNEEYGTTTYQSLFELQSCIGRCYNPSGVGIMRREGHLMGLCSCDADCEDADSCCPDFKSVCLNELFESSTLDYFSFAPEIATDGTTSTTRKTTVATSTTTAKSRDGTTSTTRTAFKTVPTTMKTTTTTKTTPTTTTTPKPKPVTTRTTTTTMRPTTTTPKPKPITTPTTTTTMRPTTTTTRKPTPTTTRIPTTPKTATTTTRKPTTAKTIVRTTKTTPTTTTTRATTRLTTATTAKATTTTASNPETTKSHKIITTTELENVNTNVNVNLPTQKPPAGSKNISYIIDSDPKVEAAHRGSSLLGCTLILILIVIVMGVAYRRYGDHAVAWYMIHFSKNNGGEEETSSITTSFRRPTTSTEKNERPGKTKYRTKSFFSSDMKRPLVEDDDEDDDSIAVNGNIPLKNHIYTEL